MQFPHIKAIGFDLFNTLITADPEILSEANARVIRSLRENGFSLQEEPFKEAHRQAAQHFIEECKRDGRETHNRFWISKALETMGYAISPDDGRIAKAVDAYFSAFFQYCRLIPHALEVLHTLKKHYRLGLLSNFTHAPAARAIMNKMGLVPLFDTILISGELGFRKPHPMVFERLCRELGILHDEWLYVGDDLDADIRGAQKSGLQPVWMSYVVDHQLPVIPGILSRGTGVPDPGIPRISLLKDLLSLLKK